LDAGDRVRGNPEFLIQSQPMLGPLLQGFKLITIATFTPDSVLYGWQSSGVRYTPQEYQQFNHFVFNPSFTPGSLSPTVPAMSSLNSEEVYQVQGNGNHIHSIYTLGIGLQSAHAFDSFVDTSAAYTGPFVGRGSLWDWLGVPPGAVHPVITIPDSSPLKYTTSSSFNWRIEPLVAYFLSCYYYFANMQEDDMYFTVGDFPDRIGSTVIDRMSTFDRLLCPIDPSNTLRVLAQTRASTMLPGYGPYDFFSSNGIAGWGGRICALHYMAYAGVRPHCGLLSVPYRPDFFNNIIKLGESPTARIPVVTDEETGDSVAVPDMRLQTKIQRMLDRLFVSGGRIGDVYRTLMGEDTSPYVDKPEFLGIWQASINPSNVVATSNGVADDESVTTGQMTARIDRYSSFNGRKGLDFKADVPGTVMFISVLVPDVFYSQGIDPGLLGSSFADDFNPEMNGLGFVSVPRSRYSLLPIVDDTTSYLSGSTHDPTTVAVGDTVAWDYYKTDYPRLHGELSTMGYYEYWTLTRRYTEIYQRDKNSSGPLYRTVDNFSTYINPLDYQYVFTGQTFNDPNFIVLANIDLKVVNKVSSSYMPYLSK